MNKETKEYFLLDKKGFIIGKKIFKIGTQTKNSVEVTNEVIKFIKPLYKNKRWYEGADNNEIRDKLVCLKTERKSIVEKKFEIEMNEILPLWKQIVMIRNGDDKNEKFNQIDKLIKNMDSKIRKINGCKNKEELKELTF